MKAASRRPSAKWPTPWPPPTRCAARKRPAAPANTSNETLKLAKARYEGGVDSHLRYLDAQRSSFVNDSTLIETSTQRQLALVDLFRALGGGWSGADASVESR